MNKDLASKLSGMTLSEPASEEVLKTAALELGVPFPEAYLDLMRYTNGAEGDLGESYLVLWPANKLVDYNEAYAVDEFAPGLVLFGTDGGNEGFAFDIRSDQFHAVAIVNVPLVGMSLEDAQIVSSDFMDFLESLESGDW